MLIAGLNKTTLLDYPGRVAATVFVGGCNFRCPFCHNGGLVLDPLYQGVYSEEEILSFLKKRKSVLRGVCITGGEPTLHADLPEFIEKIRALGYQVKLDTNGYAPHVLEQLLGKQMVDYVAMDIKNCREKYAMTVGTCDEDSKFCLDRLEQSVELLKQSGIDYEFRTTVVKELHTGEDLLKIAEWIKGCPRYFLQQYQDNENVIRQGFHGYSKDEMERIAESIREVLGMNGEIALRGVD